MITEENIQMLSDLSEKHGFGPVEFYDDILEITQWGISVQFEKDVLSNKSLLGTVYHDGYVVYQTYGDDGDIGEYATVRSFLDAAIAMLTRIYEMQLTREVFRGML